MYGKNTVPTSLNTRGPPVSVPRDPGLGPAAVDVMGEFLTAGTTNGTIKDLTGTAVRSEEICYGSEDGDPAIPREAKGTREPNNRTFC